MIPRLLSQELKPIAPGVYLKSKRGEARQFLERLLDQNEQALGLFYLHPDAALGLAEPAVAFLRVTVALKSEHYDLIRSARRGRLSPEFRAKFGWLVGNLYSRAASPDWADQVGGAGAKKQLISRYLDATIADGPCWLDDEVLQSAEEKKMGLPNSTGTDFVRDMERFRPKPLTKQLAEESSKQAKNVIERIAGEIRKGIAEVRQRSAALTTEELATSAVETLASLTESLQKVESQLAELDQAHEKLGKRLANNKIVARLVKASTSG